MSKKSKYCCFYREETILWKRQTHTHTFMGNSNAGAGVNSGVVTFPARVGVGVRASFSNLYTELKWSWSNLGWTWSGVRVDLWSLWRSWSGAVIARSGVGVTGIFQLRFNSTRQDGLEKKLTKTIHICIESNICTERRRKIENEKTESIQKISCKTSSCNHFWTFRSVYHAFHPFLLCVPATSTPAGWMFSCSSFLMRIHRSRLAKDASAKSTFVESNLDLLNWACHIDVEVQSTNHIFTSVSGWYWWIHQQKSFHLSVSMRGAFQQNESELKRSWIGVGVESWTPWSWSWSGVSAKQVEL